MPLLRASLAAFGAVLRNRRILLVELAYIGFNLAEWAIWIAMLVFAYSQGGASQVGLAVFVQLAPSAFLAPIGATLGDRYRRDRMLVISYVAQAAAMLATAAALATAAPLLVIYALAAAANTTITLTRPLQASLLPLLAETPAELTAANVVGGSIENASILVGPALAGLSLGVSGPALVFAASAAVAVVAAVLVALASAPEARQGGVRRRAGGAASPLADTAEGLRVLARRGRPRTVVALLGSAALVWGALDLFIVVLALRVLNLGEPAVGYLNAAFGAGGLVGAALTVALIGRPRLAFPFAAGTLLFGLPLALLPMATMTSTVVAAALLLAVSGAGRSVMDVAGRTLLQRVAPHALLTRVFGVLEGLNMGSLAVGTVIASGAVALLGPDGAFLVAGLALPAALLVTSPALRQMDAAAEIHLAEVAILRSIAIFAPLSALALERLAASLVPMRAPSGSIIITEGETGDRYYVVASGRVEVLIGGRPVRQLSKGEGFGEIALLREVPRTATVRAIEDVELLTLGRDLFLEAVTGHPQSTAAAEVVISQRLSTRGG
ncbi:MAG: cyclic nucleotide-binding domain-containing protein [Chloroflexota bacterium]|nr:cyclic nucleotide-binding domain-containing protein [Chloroflexota bacterium]